MRKRKITPNHDYKELDPLDSCQIISPAVANILNLAEANRMSTVRPGLG
jgi:hypothetical protein